MEPTVIGLRTATLLCRRGLPRAAVILGLMEEVGLTYDEAALAASLALASGQ